MDAGAAAANSFRSLFRGAKSVQHGFDTLQARYQGTRIDAAHARIQKTWPVVIHPKSHHQPSSVSKQDGGAV